MKFVSKYEYKSSHVSPSFSTFSILRGEYGIGVRFQKLYFKKLQRRNWNIRKALIKVPRDTENRIFHTKHGLSVFMKKCFKYGLLGLFKLELNGCSSELS